MLSASPMRDLLVSLVRKYDVTLVDDGSFVEVLAVDLDAPDNVLGRAKGRERLRRHVAVVAVCIDEVRSPGSRGVAEFLRRVLCDARYD